ncbi:hypothetical protein PIB30_075738 [Stylosanthes scabra]|uniref:Uncharacterized protein n=1 Tax=Stylosanthes scabra TaxID=79078 RepID=A0ABU6TPR1_9FABA|nr:hypothetical protein [Stylosanthes scabra]
MRKRRFHKRSKHAKRRNGAIVIGLEQTWTLWKDELNVYSFHVEDFFRFFALTSRASQQCIIVHMKICVERALQMARPRHPLLNDEVYVEGAGTRWTWRMRAIVCCALNLKAKKGI